MLRQTEPTQLPVSVNQQIGNPLLCDTRCSHQAAVALSGQLWQDEAKCINTSEEKHDRGIPSPGP